MSSYRLLPPSQPKSAPASLPQLDHPPLSLQANLTTHAHLTHREPAQDNLALTLKRDIYGMHAPMRLLMERKLVNADHHMSLLPRSNLHLDILMGRDDTIEPADVFGGMETNLPLDIHRDMEKKWRL
ncbi:hypothetical protein APHAL10511_006196 [Amanita phalloides]|nr:hypothetical protein APHAL10511_006196 [Amanita phalloides]